MNALQSIPIEWLDAFAAGVYLLFAIIHLDLWLRRPERHAHLWLCLASSGALTVDLSGMVLRPFPPFGGPFWIGVVNTFGVAITTIALFELVVTISGRPAGRVGRSLEATVLLLALGQGVFRVNAASPLLFLCAFALFSIAFVRAWQAGRGGEPESTTIARGLMVLIASLLLDVANLLRVIPKIPGLPIVGFVTLFIASARALNARYDREYRELMALRSDLEHRVRERTVALEAANDRLEELSRTDPLTTLPNRRAFVDAAEQECRRSARAMSPFSLLMIDIDHFKRVNDTFGHAAGDAVMVRLAEVLRGGLRAQDIVSRWGGEEFIVLLPDTGAEGAARAAEGLRSAVAASSVEWEGETVSITASFGVAAYQQGSALATVISAADAALYRAKQEGRDRVAVA